MAKFTKKEVGTVERGFVYHGVRWGFGLVVLLLLVSFLIPPGILTFLVSLIWLILALFTIITAIIHLSKYRKKGFAITALIITVLLLMFYVIGIVTKTSSQ